MSKSKLSNPNSNVDVDSTLLNPTSTNKQYKGDRYLFCQITPELNALINMESVRETMLISREEVTPIPRMSPFVMGLVNSRERVFLAIDLPQMLGLPYSLARIREYSFVVINISPFLDSVGQTEEILLALGIMKTQGIKRIESFQGHNSHQNRHLKSHNLQDYIQNWANYEEQTLPTLDLAQIIKKTYIDHS